MPCYNYTSGDPIFFDPNLGLFSVEKIFADGVTLNYDSIARICEIDDEDQLCVYTRATPAGTETKLTLSLDYTVNPTTKVITVTNNPNPGGQIVIRRCTPNTKLLATFIEGGKISANDLNLSLHQLLFLVQEKEFIGSTVNEFYPLSIHAPNWVAGTVYTAGQFVNKDGSIFKCITGHTASVGNAPPGANWSLINPASAGFIIDGGATLSGPVTFDLDGVSIGHTLTWNGTKFEAGLPILDLDDINLVTITGGASGDLFRFNGINWENATPTVNIFINNPIFKSYPFTDRSQTGGSSFTNNAVTDPPVTTSTIPSDLNIFRDASNNYVIPDVPTVYHVLNKLTPGYNPSLQTPDFKTFLAGVKTNIDLFSANISNPVKAKLFWTLNRNRTSQDNASPADNLQNFKTAFWDSPAELYHADMWTLIDNIAKHEVTTSGGVVYRQSAFHAYQAGTYTSKVYGYGIKSKGFYLNVPECYTTSLVNLPIFSPTSVFSSESSHTFFQSTDLVYNHLVSVDSTLANGKRDTYLWGLRDMMAASASKTMVSNSNPGTSTDANNLRLTNQQTRFIKGNLIWADYTGWSDVSYKRLELAGEGVKTCLFKIPKQIIYYNKAALGLSVRDPAIALTVETATHWPITSPTAPAALNNILSKQVRFTGPGTLVTGSINANSTVSYVGMGSFYKSDSLWENWCNAWSSDATAKEFNEADIDWQVHGVADSNVTSLNLFTLQGTNQPDLGTANVDSDDYDGYYPWPYRPNMYGNRSTGINTLNSYTGTHLLNLDYNKFFSEASNYIPDPRDEYVFRIILKDNLTAFFNKPGSSTVASSIIIEHGFSDSIDEGILGTGKNLANEIYTKNWNNSTQSKKVKARLNKNDVKVFVQSEHIESFGGTDQYVINLCISVPRLKSIGYCNIFRYGNTAATSVPNDNDTNKELGPWSFYIGDAGITFSSGTVGANITFPGSNLGTINTDYSAVGTQWAVKYSPVAGRNECAVKFTRLGLPHDLWIKLSVLNTEGTLSLLNGSTWNTALDL